MPANELKPCPFFGYLEVDLINAYRNGLKFFTERGFNNA